MVTGIYLSKQQAPDPNQKVIKEISFVRNLQREVIKTTFFITEEKK